MHQIYALYLWSYYRRESSCLDSRDVLYLQSQNGNLYREDGPSAELPEVSDFEALKRDVPHGIDWATDALGQFEKKLPGFMRAIIECSIIPAQESFRMP